MHHPNADGEVIDYAWVSRFESLQRTNNSTNLIVLQDDLHRSQPFKRRFQKEHQSINSAYHRTASSVMSRRIIITFRTTNVDLPSLIFADL